MWRADRVILLLREMLVWLTDDDWDLEFVTRDAPACSGESVRFLFPNPAEGSVVSLYSGGLDSFAGLALDLAEGTVPVLVSIVPNSRRGASQSHTVEALCKQLGVSVPRIAVKGHLRGVEPRESSHRTRGFGFLAVAASVAAMSDIGRVQVYENGIGAINLPYSRAQGGAQSTRSMHPGTLSRAAALFSAMLGHPIAFVNSNQYRTKGELCRRIPAGLRSVVPRAMSCDMASVHRASKIPNCGVCTSCLLRRQALWSAGLGAVDQQTSYRTDVVSGGTQTPEESLHLKMMLSQAIRLERALHDSNPRQSLHAEFPELVDAFSALEDRDPAVVVEEQIVGMYGRYVNEWRSFPVEIARAYLPSPLMTRPARPGKGAQCPTTP